MFSFSSPNERRVGMIPVHFKKLAQMVGIADSLLQPQVAVFHGPHQTICPYVCVLPGLLSLDPDVIFRGSCDITL